MLNFLDLSSASEEERRIITEILADTSVVNIAQHLCPNTPTQTQHNSSTSTNTNITKTTTTDQQQLNNIKNTSKYPSTQAVREAATQSTARGKDSSRFRNAEQTKRLRSNHNNSNDTTTTTATNITAPSLNPTQVNTCIPQVPNQQPTQAIAVSANSPSAGPGTTTNESEKNDSNTIGTSPNSSSSSSSSSNLYKNNNPPSHLQHQSPPQHSTSALANDPQKQKDDSTPPPNESQSLQPQATPGPTLATPETSDINSVIGLDISPASTAAAAAAAAAAAVAAASTQPPGYAISPHVTPFAPAPPHHHHVYGGPPLLQPYHYFIHPYNIPPGYMPYVIAPNSVVPPTTTATRQQVSSQLNQQAISSAPTQQLSTRSIQNFHHMSVQQNHQYNSSSSSHETAIDDNHHHHHHSNNHHNSSGHHQHYQRQSHHHHHQHHHNQPQHNDSRTKIHTNHQPISVVGNQMPEKQKTSNSEQGIDDMDGCGSAKSTINGVRVDEVATPTLASKLSNNDNMVTKLTDLMTASSLTQKSANELDANHKMPNNDSSKETHLISQELNSSTSSSTIKKPITDSSPLSIHNKASNSLAKNGHSLTNKSKNYLPNNARGGEKAQNNTPKPDIDSTNDNVSKTQANNTRNNRLKNRDSTSQMPRSAFLGPKLNGNESIKHSPDKGLDIQSNIDISKQHSNQPSISLASELSESAPPLEEKSKACPDNLEREKDELSDAKSSGSNSDTQRVQGSWGMASSKSWASLFKSQQEYKSTSAHQMIAKE